MLSSDDKSNLPEFTVSQISGAVKKTLEDRFAQIRVRGEITECKSYASGHIYYSLKDEDSRIKAIVWRSKVRSLGLQPEDGLDVIVTGKISSYPRSSQYQLITDNVEYAGVGAMLARIEKLRKDLAQEGLFSQEHKKPLPFLPKIVGVVTSPQGAVIHDICTTLRRRFPRTVLLWPVPVQGEGAALKIQRAIEGFSRLYETQSPHTPDVVIVARGGGSVEELMPFSDEGVVRAAFNCPIPIISAVGHETDNPLIDDVADRRAPTPTAAAEMAVPNRDDLLQNLQSYEQLMAQYASGFIQKAQKDLSDFASRLPDLQTMLAQARYELGSTFNALFSAGGLFFQRCETQLAGLTLPKLRSIFQECRYQVKEQTDGIVSYVRGYLKEESIELKHIRLVPKLLDTCLEDGKTTLQNLSLRLDAVSPYSVLNRGYVMVTTQKGEPIQKAQKLKNHQPIDLIFSDGRRRAIVEGKSASQGLLDFNEPFDQ